MKKFDLIVIGAGSGLTVSSFAASRGEKVAVIESGPFGGTCLNRGCIPSKMLIHAADVAETIQNSEKFGIQAKMSQVNFKSLVDRVNRTVSKDAKNIEEGNVEDKNITVFIGEAKFIDKKVVQVGKEKITAEKIVIASGARPFIPPIEGLDKVKYLTSKEALKLKKLPKTLTVIGGGYISAELSHFYGSLGTKVTIIERNPKMVKNEDFEVSEEFTRLFSKKHKVLLNQNAERVSRVKGGVKVEMKDLKTGKKQSVISEQLLVVVGVRPNSDKLNLKEVGIKLNKRGYVKVNKYMQTNIPGVYALGDIAGVYLFKHSANLEAVAVVRNIYGNKKEAVNYKAMPHAIFTSPQIAGVGMTEQELKEKKIAFKSAKYYYKRTGMGLALRDETSFVKAFADPKTGKILGCHILGPDASTLIHEVIPIMRKNGKVKDITDAIHIHPALPEVVQRCFAKLR